MLNFQPLSMGLKTLADSYTFKYGEGSCQHSFVSSWCLRDKYGDSFCEHDGFLYILRSKLCTENERVYLFPLGPRDDTDALRCAVQNVIDDAHSYNCRVKFQTVTESAKDAIMELFPGRFEVHYSRDLAEYIYDVNSQVTLSGKHLQWRRRDFNRFCREYAGRFETLKISPEHIEGIRECQQKWREEKFLTLNGITPALETLLRDENKGVQCALDDFFELGMSGVVILIDGEISAYMYGFPLNSECFDARSGKGDIDVPRISGALKREFARLCCEGYKYVNFEEDLGIPGLREMKVEYYPVRMIEKFILTEI